MKVKELIENKNKIEAQIASIEMGIINSNTQMLMYEVLNLIDEVGDGFIPDDYYAGSRYYSQLPGVKNLRIKGNVLSVKALSPKGYLLPLKIVVRGVEYSLEWDRSKNYMEGIDY